MAIDQRCKIKGSSEKRTNMGHSHRPSGAKYLRRYVTAGLILKKKLMNQMKFITDYQVADYRHGVRSAEGTLSGELSPGSYADFMAAVV